MDTWRKQIIIALREELRRLFIISVSVFIFILFFQPFPLEMLVFNDRLLFVTGFAFITFFVAGFSLILLPSFFPKWFKISEMESGPPLFLSFLFIVLMATAFTFYIRYVGMVSLSLYILFKIALVCFLPLTILIILHKNKLQERIIHILQDQNKSYLSKITEFETVEEVENIDLFSTNKSEKFTVNYKNIISIKSADNYIEIYYLENEKVEKKLMRSTLKNIQSQLANNNIFIRCHRTSIVNTLFIEGLTRTYNGYSLKMNCFENKIPVSRQYLLLVKEAISVNE